MAFFLCSLITASIEGESYMVATRLTQAMDDASATATVMSTDGFPSSGVIEIGSEEIKYDGISDTSFTVKTRGFNETVAIGHGVGERIYGEDSAVINKMLGFNVTQISTNAGWFAIPSFLWQFTTKSVPKLIMWDFPFLKDGEIVLLRYFLMTFSTGFAIYMVAQIIMVLGGIARSIIGRL